MRISLNTSKWYDNVWAAFIFFTRLPLWRLHEPPRECYRTVVEHWSLVGWLTGAVMGAIIYFGGMVFPHTISVLLAIAARILITGALHEDGLADFFDGFGGGSGNRQRTLDIMKDSHIGTYGVVGLILYFLLLFFSLSALPSALAALTIFAADPFCKMVSGQIIGLLRWDILIFAPCLVMYFMYLLIWHRLKGYTGDCCGAMFLITELSFYLCTVYQFINNKSLWTLF